MMAGAAPTEAGVDALIAAIDALGARDYPEIGVPAFLVGEDLTAETAMSEGGADADAALAAELARLVAAIGTRRPQLDAATIAQLLELLADRHFMGSATPFSHRVDLHPAPAR